MEAIPDTGDLGRSVQFKQAHRRTAERALVDDLRIRYPQRPRPLCIGSADKEMRPLPVIAHQERTARLQSSIDMDDGNALPVRSGDDAIAGLKDESADFGHPAILPHGCELWHAWQDVARERHGAF